MDINADTLDAAPRTVHKQMAHFRPHTRQGYNLFQGWRDVVTVLLPQDRSRSLEEVGLAPVEAYAVYDFVNLGLFGCKHARDSELTARQFGAQLLHCRSRHFILGLRGEHECNK